MIDKCKSVLYGEGLSMSHKDKYVRMWNDPKDLTKPHKQDWWTYGRGFDVRKFIYWFAHNILWSNTSGVLVKQEICRVAFYVDSVGSK